MDSVFVAETFTSIAPWMAFISATQEQLPIAPWMAFISATQEQLPIAPWMAFIRATQEHLPGDAGVELTWTYLQRVAVANTGFMSAPKLGPVKIGSFDLVTK